MTAKGRFGMPTMSQFFAGTLRAPLANTRWSWGARDPSTDRVFLRIWSDQMTVTNQGEFVVVIGKRWGRSLPGFPERKRHIDAIRAGSEGFGVVCVAKEPTETGTRKIASFQNNVLLRIGDFVERDGDTLARVLDRLPVSEITLTREIASIVARDGPDTVKLALVDARMGQGAFRAGVLNTWHARCAVTGCGVLEAVRASHIKPWRLATDAERLDPSNGLPLVANLDALFDAGLISFGRDGEMLVSPALKPAEQNTLGVVDRSLAGPPGAKTAAYLRFHRENIFQG